MTSPTSAVIHAADVRARIPGAGGEHYADALRRGALDVKLSLGRFAPRPNRQSPHAQDELYAVMSGRGFFRHGDRREAFEAGDLLFVAAGVEHGFEEFSDDLAVWVIFFGPEGGPTPPPPSPPSPPSPTSAW